MTPPSEQPHAAHGDDGHGHTGSPFIQHHYDDAQHQFDAGKLGIWIFLAQEVLFFSALFVAYILYRFHHPEIYSYAHKYLDVNMGAINTAVLIFSSLTAAWAVRAAQLGQRKLLIACLAGTLLCALTFLGVKYVEYSHKIHEHILFGARFDPCVSSGGIPLLTKNNECPGHKSSILWDAESAKPVQGCFADVGVDTDLRKPGVQADCEVSETTIEIKKDAAGNIEKDKKTGKWVIEPKASKPIPKACPPLSLHDEHRHDASNYPCWRAAAQPAVCRPGWFYTLRCTAGSCAPGGKASFVTSDSFKDRAECIDGRSTKDKELKNVVKGEEDKKVSPLTTYEISDCTRSDQVGIIVEYGDHEERPEEVIVTATCKAPPKAVATPNLSDLDTELVLGKKAIDPQTPVTTHDAHELEAMGPPPDNTGMFFTIYFAMTGLHGIHVLFGVFVFIWLLIRAIKGQFTPDYFGPVDFAALYWHIVDLIWIFLFPLLYLIH
ncbi:MAG: cytochrome c oxidase subunit [Deltaproteobacteria bacterium]|nr:cytochrome c oxidase subunit [Deltaproteobacteria bacterium]